MRDCITNVSLTFGVVSGWQVRSSRHVDQTETASHLDGQSDFCTDSGDHSTAGDSLQRSRKRKRTQSMTVVTTLIEEELTKEEIAELYGFRWNVELDLRCIKETLNLGHLRCKSPAMIRCELWTTMLSYNLIRTTAAGARCCIINVLGRSASRPSVSLFWQPGC